jgi:hypothetical protein
MNFNSLDDFLVFRIGFPSTGPSRRLEPLGAEGQRGNVANENCLMVLVRARQRKRQSMEGFAQEDIPEGSKSNAGRKENVRALAAHRQTKGPFRLGLDPSSGRSGE